MINVFKKRTRLYALTTSAFFFLQGVGASIANGAGAIPGGVGVGGVLGGVGGDANACNVVNYKSIDEPLSPIVCNDRKEHSMKYSTVMVRKEGGAAVTAGRANFYEESDAVEGSGTVVKPTVIKLYSSSLRNQPDSGAQQDVGLQYGSAVFASQDGVVKLERSWIHNFDTGLYALHGGQVVMEKGRIHSAIMGAEAVRESFIVLGNTEINVSGQQWSLDSEGDGSSQILDDSVTGLRATTGSVIDMKFGKVTLPAGGTVASVENGGFIQLDSVNIIIDRGNSKAAESRPVSSFLFTDGGFISVKNENINHSNSVGVWVFDNDEDDSVTGEEDNDTRVKRIQIDDPSAEFLASSEYTDYLIPKILGQKTREGIDEERTDESDFKIKASVKSSTISLSGQSSIGIYFDNQYDDSEQGQLKSGKLQNKESLVFLQNATFNVSDGLAILANNMRGSVLIDSASNVSGNVFLKAVSTSEVLVFVNHSTIRGAAYVEKGSQGKIYLNGSMWDVRKNKFGRSDNGCGDSCISFVKLNDSTISFSSLQNGANQQNYNYQTFRIGNGEGTVYAASGDSHIYFGASVLMADASEDSQLSDRLLIHGDVSGQTKVHVHKIRQDGDLQDQHAQGYKPQSISIIQVYGEAKKDSFKLNDAYVTIGGSPYQYILRAYGPTTPSKMKYFDNRLAKSRQIWDYRLESKIEATNGIKKEPPLASEVVLAEYMLSFPRSFDIVPDNIVAGLEYLDSFEVNGKNGGGDFIGTRVVASAGAPGPNLGADTLGRSDSVDTDHEGSESDPSTISSSSSTVLQTLPAEETVDQSEEREADRYILGGGLRYNEELQTSDGSTGILLLAVDGSKNSSRNGNEVEYNIVDGDNSDLVSVNSLGEGGSALLPETENSLTNENSETLSTILLDNSSGGLDDVGYGIIEERDDTTEIVSISSPTVMPSAHQSVTTESAALARSDVGDSDGDLSLLSEISSVSETEEDTPSSALAVLTTENPVSSSGTVDSNGESPNVENSASATGVTIDVSSEGERISSSESSVSEGTKPVVLPVLEEVEVSKAVSTESERKESAPNEEGTKTLGRERILLLSEDANTAGKSSPAVSVNLSSASTEIPKPVSSTQPVVSLGRSEASPVVPVYSVLLGNVSSRCADTMKENGAKESQFAYSCSDGQSHTIQGQTLKTTGKTQHSMHAKNQNTVIKLERGTIIGADPSDSKNNVDSTTLQAVSAVLAENNARVVLDKNSKIQSSVIGLEAQRGGTVEMIGGMVNARYVGTLAGSGSSVNLKDTRINVMGNFAAAGLVSKAGEITMNTGAITLAKGAAVRSEAGGSVKLDKVDITLKKEAGTLNSAKVLGRTAFLLRDNASVDFKNGNVVTDARALWIVKSGDSGVEAGSSRRRRSPEVRPAMNHANIESSTVKVEGEGTYGIYFDGLTLKGESKQNRNKDLAASGERSEQANTAEKTSVVKRSAVSKQEKEPIGITGTVSLKKTDFEVAKGIAIYGNNSGGRVSLENKTTLAGDLLLKAENDSNVSISVDSSIVTGGVRVDKSSYAKLDLTNSSEWILKRSVQNSSGTPDLGCLDSCLSSVRLVNSAINFAPSESGRKYQTLHIGNGEGIVYEAQGDAVIHLNARLNPHDSSGQQVTDRLIIHGDVSGKTKIHVRGDAGNGGNGQANAKIAHSVSIIQVYGQAKKDSFQLDGNYVALINSPYKYTLRAYGPEVTSKQGHVQQKFVKDGGEFWNFRLENQYVKSAGSVALPQQFIRSVVPQVPTYLVLPNSVFHAGLMDINNQSKQLETLRMTSTGMVEVRENPALYLRGYGGSYRYASDLSALEYGYGGDLDYRGVEAGVLLQTIENTDSALSFGVMGTYGNLSLQPLNVEQSQKSAFDKWTATVYGSMQHNIGFYVDGLLSYGLFNGDVLTTARGKTTTLKGNPLSVSLSGGQTIATGYKGFVFDPQVQVVYQHLQFNKARDIDNFDIEIGNLDQWVARVGGRLTKIPTGSEGVDAVAFYGKLYLAHGFGEKQTVHFSDSFKLGAFGSALEAGLGFNAKLLPQFSLHADILYQHKLNKAGFSGASFSGGVRYQF